MNRISSKELTEWIAFAQVEPFGVEAQFLGHAITATTVANVNRGKNQNPFDVDDFMPKFEHKAQSTEEMLQFAQMITIGLGGQDKRGEDGG